MNKIRGLFKITLAIIMLGLFVPSVVLAADSTYLDGVDLASPGETISYDIKVSALSTIDSYTTEFSYEGSILELISIENQGNWKGDRENAIGPSPVALKFTHDGGVAGETTIATLKFKVKASVAKSETRLTIKSVIGFENVNTPLAEYAKNIAIKSTDNTLKDLKINGKTVVNFSPSTYSYSIQVEAITTSANVDATLNDSTATFVENYGARSIQLDYGENSIEVKVKAASGAEKSYIINITRMDNRGTNNDLKTLILNAGKVKLNFDKDVLEYKIKTYKLTSVDVEATTVDTKATFKIDKPEELIVGENIINVIVTSEDGNEKTYKIILNNVDYDIDTTLKDIEIFGLDTDLEFDPKILDYEIIYKSKYKDSLVIKPILNTSDEDVKIDEPLLEKTSSTIEAGSIVQIRVYAGDGTESIYTISFVKDNRINFFFLLGLVIFIVLLIIFISLFINRKKTKETQVSEEKKDPKELEKTKKLQKINLE